MDVIPLCVTIMSVLVIILCTTTLTAYFIETNHSSVICIVSNRTGICCINTKYNWMNDIIIIQYSRC